MDRGRPDLRRLVPALARDPGHAGDGAGSGPRSARAERYRARGWDVGDVEPAADHSAAALAADPARIAEQPRFLTVPPADPARCHDGGDGRGVALQQKARARRDADALSAERARPG